MYCNCSDPGNNFNLAEGAVTAAIEECSVDSTLECKPKSVDRQPYTLSGKVFGFFGKR